MSEVSYAYPEQEHLDRARDMVGVLGQELETYRDGPSLRDTSKWLLPMYGKSPFAQALQRYAQILQQAHIFRPPPHYNPEHTIATSFYMGGLMGMHCLMRPLSWDERRSVINWNFMDTDSIENEAQREQYLEALGRAALRAEDYAYTVLAERSNEEQELTLAAAIRTFDGVTHATSKENEYVFGFVFTGVMVRDGLQRQKAMHSIYFEA